MIDNAVLNHIMKKNLWFFMRNQNFEQKGVLGLGFSEKYLSEANKFWPAAQVSHFLMI